MKIGNRKYDRVLCVRSFVCSIILLPIQNRVWSCGNNSTDALRTASLFIWMEYALYLPYKPHKDLDSHLKLFTLSIGSYNANIRLTSKTEKNV